ncbi:MAG: type II toxin-antitoxin system RelE/ParE family toxin [Ginsengibacter sp.]
MKPFKGYYILPAARDELREARKWYASQNVKGLSNRFSLVVKDAILQILKNPGAYTMRYKNVRIAHTATFPYAIHFLTQDNTITIIAIIYDRRNPAITIKRV